MREPFFKMLPYLLGGFLGFLITFPPDSFLALGPWRPLILACIVIVGLLAVTGLQLAISLPRDVNVEPLAETLAPDVAALIHQYRAIGFELVIPLLRVDIRPSGTLSIMVNRSAGCWGSVFVTGTVPRRVGYDIYSIIEGERGSLTSLAEPGAAVLPLAPGCFKQVFHGATPEVLLARHREAQAFLSERGVRFDPPGPQDVPARIRRSLNTQRQIIAANPLKAAALVLWRATTKSTPYNLPVASQKGTEATLRYLLRGESAPARALT